VGRRAAAHGAAAHGGLALASSIGAYANLVLLVMIARRRFGVLGVRSIAASLDVPWAASIGLAVWCALPAVVAGGSVAQREAPGWPRRSWLARSPSGSPAAHWRLRRDALAAILPSRRSR